jgi:antibiotic biosynthesis monooxygenase (ABM) superfamily enzyme
VLLQWTARVQPEHARSPRWYMVGGILVVALTAYAIVTRVWTLAIVSMALGGVYFLTRNENAAERTIEIHEDGYVFENRFIPWNDCKDFWLLQFPGYVELHICRKRAGKREMVIQTGDIDVALLCSTLSRFLPLRADQHERLIDAFIRLCKL